MTRDKLLPSFSGKLERSEEKGETRTVSFADERPQGGKFDAGS